MIFVIPFLERSVRIDLRTVTVDGVAHVPLAQGANVAVATAAYRQAMADAIARASFTKGFVAA